MPSDPGLRPAYAQPAPASHEPTPLLSMVYALLAEIVAQLDSAAAYKARLQAVLDAAEATERAGVAVSALPLLVCQAIGQPPQHALPVAAAWRAALIAAKLLDDVEDGDVSQMSADRLSGAQVINIATGLLAVANLALARLPLPLWRELQLDLQQTILRTAGGQHAELCPPSALDLEGYFEVLAAKSGACFAFAAGAGAACGTADRALIDSYRQFGYNVGVMVQIANDLAGLRRQGSRGDLAGGHRTLAVRYGLTVAAPAERARLERLLASAGRDAEAERQARHLLVALGAEIYLLSEIARYRRRLHSMLAHDEPTPSSMQALYNWLAALQANVS